MAEKYDQHLLINDLIERGIISHTQALTIEAEAKHEVSLVPYLQRVYKIDPWVLTELEAIRKQYLFCRWDIKDIQIPIIKIVPLDQVKQFQCIPIRKQGDELIAVFSDKDSLELRNLLSAYFPECKQQKLYFAPSTFLDQTIALVPKDPIDIFKQFENLERWTQGNSVLEDLRTDTVLQTILEDAHAKRASDIHFEPDNGNVQIRLRIDGGLKLYHRFSDKYWGYLAGRIKVLSGMNTAENRRPQNGRFSQRLNGHEIDIRTASHPTTQGESMVLRLLDKHKMVVSLEKLGFCEDSLYLLRKMYSTPHGLVLFTGPTGSGKTTTLYSILNQLNQEDTNIMTLEDPVEYDLRGIRQTSVQENVLNFKEGIRAILRQDPDIILIGEIRDEDTARMAFRASQTGHLVFSTLHTNDVWGVFARLMDLGISFESIKHTVVGLVSQRLVKKRCNCFPEGCEKCDFTTFYGRVAIGEMLWMTPQLRSYLKPNAVAEIPEEILKKHYLSLKEAGEQAVNAGLTTTVEVKRYCGGLE